MSIWVGACGAMSRNATQWASSYTMSAGISRRMMRSKSVGEGMVRRWEGVRKLNQPMHRSFQRVDCQSGCMPTVYITRRARFNAAHRLHNPAKSVAWNQATFGACNNANWHGHNYLLEVTVAGTPASDTGYVLDLALLKTIMDEHIVRHVDHRNLNLDVAFLNGVLPSTENLVIAFWNRLAPHIPAGRLHCVRLFETERNYAEYLGPTHEEQQQ